MAFFKKKNKDIPEEPRTVAEETPAEGQEETQSAAEETPAEGQEEARNVAEDVNAIMEKYDRESNVRHYAGVPKRIVQIFLVAFSLYAIYINLFALWDERTRRASFVGLLILMAFTVFPARKHGKRVRRTNYVPIYDIVLGLLGAGAFFYLVANVPRLVQVASRINTTDIVVGIIGVIVLLEACRRVVGIPIVVVASAFIVYAFAMGKPLKVIVYNLFYTTEGVMGTPISVCSTFIVLFIIFGAFLERTGISDFFINLANSVAGASSGGPAKVAVISSALCGMVSGSSVANTVTTGSITIPMMKKTGYRGEFAGAVEAAASTGGQIMPPIMGAAAFLMAEFVGVGYGSIAVRAILPAVLYFTGIFVMVHLEAKKLGLKGLSRDQLPNFFKLVVSRGYLLLPLVILVYMIIAGYTMSRAAMFATATAIVVSMFRKDTRLTPARFLDALESAARSTISVGVACAVAGIIAGVVTMTGLGQILINGIVALAGNATLVALVLTMIACIVLGMGVPTTANYVIMATTCAPILINGMGIEPIAAHMFVFYFGIVADITPPVALAAYAGSAIAASNPMKTGLNASRLAIAAFIVPYIFVLNPAMLFVDTTVWEVILIIITSLTGIFGVSAGLEGYIIRNMNVFEGLLAKKGKGVSKGLSRLLTFIERLPAIVGGLLLIDPNIITDVIGVALIALAVVIQLIGKWRLGDGELRPAL